MMGEQLPLRLFRELKVWALEKLQEIYAESEQKMYKSIENCKMAAKQTALDLTSEKIPKLDPIHPGTDNNLAQWLFTINKWWRLCVEYNQTSMSALINTIKEHSGPLRTSLLHKNTYHEVWTIIKRKVLNGRAAIQNMFNITGPGFQIRLDTGKCLDIMEVFIMVAKLVINLKLHWFFEPEDIKSMARSLFLFTDLSEFYSVLSKRKAEGRSGDISTIELQELIALVREDPNT